MPGAHTVQMGTLAGRVVFFGTKRHADLETALRVGLAMPCTAACVIVRDFATGRRFSQAEAGPEQKRLEYDRNYLWEMENL